MTVHSILLLFNAKRWCSGGEKMIAPVNHKDELLSEVPHVRERQHGNAWANRMVFFDTGFRMSEQVRSESRCTRLSHVQHLD